jgi:hypothetical protein
MGSAQPGAAAGRTARGRMISSKRRQSCAQNSSSKPLGEALVTIAASAARSASSKPASIGVSSVGVMARPHRFAQSHQRPSPNFARGLRGDAEPPGDHLESQALLMVALDDLTAVLGKVHHRLAQRILPLMPHGAAADGCR